MKKFDEIQFRGLDWFVLDTNKDTTKLLLKNILDEERIKKYSTDDWYINEAYVRHSDCVRPPFNWDKSYIKTTILENFKKDLGIECEIDLLTKEEVEELPDEIRKCNDWYWTKSDATNEGDTYALVWRVFDYGYVYFDLVDNVTGARPVINLNTDNLFKCQNQLLDFDEGDIEEINKSYPIFNFDEKSFMAMKEMVQDIYSKQCELIKAVNKLKKEGE